MKIFFFLPIILFSQYWLLIGFQKKTSSTNIHTDRRRLDRFIHSNGPWKLSHKWRKKVFFFGWLFTYTAKFVWTMKQLNCFFISREKLENRQQHDMVQSQQSFLSLDSRSLISCWIFFRWAGNNEAVDFQVHVFWKIEGRWFCVGGHAVTEWLADFFMCHEFCCRHLVNFYSRTWWMFSKKS